MDSSAGVNAVISASAASASPMVYKCTKNYIDRHVRRMDVEPMLSVHEDIQRQQVLALEAEQNELVKAGIDTDYAE